MISVIGLGSCGCNMASKFAQYPQYRTFYINTEMNHKGEHTFRFPEFNSPEEYEQKCPQMSDFFYNVDDEVIFIVGGSGYISACSLRVLSYVKDKKITIVYVKPEVDFLSDTNRLMENSTFHIFQEYARSGVFERVLILENATLEKIIPDLTIGNFFQKINEFAVYAMHMVNVFDNTSPVMSNFSDLKETSRISSIGMVDLENGEEKMFFSIDNVTEKRYYFGVNSENLNKDAELLNKIKKHIKANKDNVVTSFAIYPTSYSHDLAYVVSYSSQIQTKNITPDE